MRSRSATGREASPAAAALLERHRWRVERDLRELGRRAGGDALLRRMFAYQAASGGKRLRAVLCLVAAARLGVPRRRALPLGLAAELLHNLFLVQDDLQDGDRLRRNRPAVWVRFGAANAINAADHLLAVAQRLALASDLPAARRLAFLEAFVAAFADTVHGQSLDIGRRGDGRLTVRGYLRLAALKTGPCLALPLVGALLAAGRPERELAAARRWGRLAGCAFQIRDDLIDLTTGKGRGGEVGCDIREGKPSILVALALERLRGRARRGLLAILARPRARTTAADVARVRRLYERLGVLALAQRRSESLARRAESALRALPRAAAADLAALTRFLAGRAT